MVNLNLRRLLFFFQDQCYEMPFILGTSTSTHCQEMAMRRRSKCIIIHVGSFSLDYSYFYSALYNTYLFRVDWMEFRVSFLAGLLIFLHARNCEVQETETKCKKYAPTCRMCISPRSKYLQKTTLFPLFLARGYFFLHPKHWIPVFFLLVNKMSQELVRYVVCCFR